MLETQRSVGTSVGVVLALALSACGGSASTIQFVELSPVAPRLNEITTVRFSVTDSRGLPLPGANVSFRLESDKPGVSLSPASALSTKGTGIVEVQVVAKRSVTSIVVIADAGGGKIAQSPAISFAGTVPNYAQFTFQCGEVSGDASGGRHALGAYDESRHLIAGVKLDCIAHVGDRNGDGVAGAAVSFLTEAGTIGPTETTVADVVGNAKILYKTSHPLPKDVEPSVFSWSPPEDATHISVPARPGSPGRPHYVAPLWMEPYRWVRNPIQEFTSAGTLQEPRRTDPIRKTSPPTVNNPRDNLVALIALTAGEEGFSDVNNNGTYDNGEPFDDLTEPFVDADDSGTWESDERWVDVNGNGVWDGKNGQWDASTLIWTTERIIWTGVPAKEEISGASAVIRVLQPLSEVTLDVDGFTDVRFLLTDPWYNSIAQNDKNDGCGAAVEDAPAVIVVPRAVNGGVKLTYPAWTAVDDLRIRDARDPTAPPDQRAPRRDVPIPWVVNVECRFTGSPIDGLTVVVPVVAVRGRIY